MPIYEFECPQGHITEKLLPFSDVQITDCDKCGAEAKRIMSGGVRAIWNCPTDTPSHPRIFGGLMVKNKYGETKLRKYNYAKGHCEKED